MRSDHHVRPPPTDSLLWSGAPASWTIDDDRDDASLLSPGSDPRRRHGDRTGRWTAAERHRFMQAVQMFPCGPWKHVRAVVKTRSIRQIQTHAQKLREKAARHDRGLKINVRDHTTVQLPPFFMSRGRGAARTTCLPVAPTAPPAHDKDQEGPSPNDVPLLDDCLDFFIQLMPASHEPEAAMPP
ncbi:hypothetical protein H310_03122 [Aphanomyces invadans]|uniref:HTH myb-type domain-containing protein n=1 Tax=Aphanomyces invadans TaxID=157072 RepID=A0A024UKR4_9STRA|nr:hypothetical protein H310_03122 [Aphanomyces invadans]ETW07036.1 hypothetical protein H310_03122 [Aphanomyces invadans]|eukprot:XP_008865111.1 hypothetical protein H310_03122 [Aphanomyces invadans]